jgi:hypothetical protein
METSLFYAQGDGNCNNTGDGVKGFSGFLGDKNKIPRNQLALTAPATTISEAPSTAETAEFSSPRSIPSPSYQLTAPSTSSWAAVAS